MANLANQLGKRFTDLLSSLSALGFDKNQIGHDYILDRETAALIAEEFGYSTEAQSQEILDEKYDVLPEKPDPSSLKPRAPIVTIMGHVDHGKTTILDFLRKLSVVAQEFGGITQHIGAFSVTTPLSKKQATFLDTPGHAAFLKMRQRGADVTDIVVLVVAADDLVKPQTIEAIKHCQKSQAHVIVAINKCDKPEANPQKVLGDLAAHGIYTESYGGDVQAVEVSGKTGLGMDRLEEAVVALAEILDLKASFKGQVQGHVIESQVKKGAGNVATVLILNGTLKTGAFLVAGSSWCKVRALKNEFGKIVKNAPPATPVEVYGWKELPEAGDTVLQVESESKAKLVVEYRVEKNKVQSQLEALDSINKSRVSQKQQAEKDARLRELLKHGLSADDLKKEEDLMSEVQEEVIEVPFIVKADVSGSCEAIKESIANIGNDEVKSAIIYDEVGSPTESDLDRAEAAGAHIVCFNVKVPKDIAFQATRRGVEIQEYTVIYYLIEDVIKTLSSKLKPKIETKITGEGEIRTVFSITNPKTKKKFKIAGTRVSNGVLERSNKVLVKRGDLIVFKGVMNGIKTGKEDASVVRKGSECGVHFKNWEDFEEGDVIEAYEEIEIPRYL